MPNKWILSWELPPQQLRFLIVTLLVLGIFFRFYNLDRKVYWHDEVYTSLRISGYTQAEVIQQVFNGRVISRDELQKYQRINSEKGVIDTVKSLATDVSQHPPLYYVMARFWVDWFGNSPAVTRSLSALISLLALPCFYWLCAELFETSLVGWLGISLLAISPFHVLYAQEARPYSLWTVTILLSSWALLRAIRLSHQTRALKSKISTWVIYAATLALGFYSFIFTGLVAIGHGLYVVVVEGCRWTKVVKAYGLASLAGIIAFSPWILVIIHNWANLESTTGWTTVNPPPFFLIKIWGLHLSCIFVDFGFALEHPFTYLVPPVVLVSVGYSIYLLCRHTSPRIWLFITILIGVTPLALMLPDLIWGGQRSGATRYLIPYLLGIQLAVAYLLAMQISGQMGAKQKLWQGIMIVLISVGVVSCAISSQAETWWNKVVGYYNPQIARSIDKSERPLVISNTSDINIGDVISLSYLLDAQVRFQLVVDPNIPQIPKGFSDVFLFYPSPSLQQGLEQKYKVKLAPVYQAGIVRLWKLPLKANQDIGIK
ncbi:MAG TPA: hypothetical protein DC064_18630 [Cyanobacteria bacterium UBA9273]|nr:hypothetical protein [Cyanobacteria bacterium UBA9273]